ncbi:unnamed protein product [Brassicogethes aeneus]|uniref:Uncharacterized protein n=1 Tax=Brassicogethes aeneus TaxID=1431903 RepID=A0A9P0FG28_BRAAE|nr:unnamed protein product [Brassicogethes aeneus]
MDCLQLRQPAGPFHYLISEQAKSLVALQELQHEVGALLEFRDLVMETFPNLRTKLASSTPSTMTHHHHHHHHSSNIPVSIRTGDWTPGVRVRKKLGGKDEGRNKKSGDIAIQDSGFSTETSSKETHSASSTAPPPLSAPGAPEIDEAEDELWNLLDVIHRKGTRLKDEVEALQGSLRDRSQLEDDEDEIEGGKFQRALFHASADDVRQLRKERDHLLDRLAEMEAEVLAGRVHTSRLQEDLENLLSAKQDLEEQLKAVVTQRGEVNSRIHDLHLQFVAKSAEKSSGTANSARKDSTASSSSSSSQRTPKKSSPLDTVLGDRVPKVPIPDSRKFAAILKERDPLVLQKHLLTSTVQNQALIYQLDSASRLKEKLDKAREENDELRFQLEDKNIELEGTRARVRVLEHLQKPLLNASTSPDIIPALDSSPADNHQILSRSEITTASMKAMSPLPMNLQADHSSSTESAHDQSENARKTKRPSKIPLKSYTAPKPPGGKHSPAPSARSRSGESPGRPHSAQSWRNQRSTDAASLNSKSRNSSLNNRDRDSLVQRGTLKKSSSTTTPPSKWTSGGAPGAASVAEKVRTKTTSSIWNFFRRDTGQT